MAEKPLVNTCPSCGFMLHFEGQTCPNCRSIQQAVPVHQTHIAALQGDVAILRQQLADKQAEIDRLNAPPAEEVAAEEEATGKRGKKAAAKE